MLMLQRPEITQEDLGKNRTQFIIEPLEPGFGLTLGNTMRRALLSRVPGAVSYTHLTLPTILLV